MGGTAIKGAHWVLIDLGRPVAAHTAVLDWEAAFATDYTVEVAATLNDDVSAYNWRVLFDGASPLHRARRAVARYGQSPGVPDRAVPLHVVHTVQLREPIDTTRESYGAETEATLTQPFQLLRIAIAKPAAGWGVSLWQVDLLGK